MSESVVTRPIERGDHESFRAVLAAFFAYANNPWPGDEAYAKFFGRVAAKRPDFVFLGAFEGERLLGIASVARVESSYEFRPCAYCDDVFVTPDARRRRIGQTLMNHVSQVATGWGASSVLLATDDDPQVMAFYQSAGFKRLGMLLVRPVPGTEGDG